MKKREYTFDIFCDLIDNYGDAGFCWRLACELVNRFNCSVRFWIKDTDFVLNFTPDLKKIKKINIFKWGENFPPDNIFSDFVLAGFSCKLPKNVIKKIKEEIKKPVLINIEYLSAESWVEEFHGKQSFNQNHKMKSFFYFPGFSFTTGGLLREKLILEFKKNINEKKIYFSRKFNYFKTDDIFTVFIFSYDKPWIKLLLNLWINSQNSVRLVVIDKLIIKNISSALDFDFKKPGSYQFKNLEIVFLPFLSHDDFDLLLNISDLNLVRGEDSLVRALWAKKPFLWDIYKQENGSHFKKLFAFNKILTDKWPLNLAELYCDLSLKWNTGEFSEKDWNILIKKINLFKNNIEIFSEFLQQQDDMATSLMRFCHSVV